MGGGHAELGQFCGAGGAPALASASVDAIIDFPAPNRTFRARAGSHGSLAAQLAAMQAPRLAGSLWGCQRAAVECPPGPGLERPAAQLSDPAAPAAWPRRGGLRRRGGWGGGLTAAGGWSPGSAIGIPSLPAGAHRWPKPLGCLCIPAGIGSPGATSNPGSSGGAGALGAPVGGAPAGSSAPWSGGGR